MPAMERPAMKTPATIDNTEPVPPGFRQLGWGGGVIAPSSGGGGDRRRPFFPSELVDCAPLRTNAPLRESKALPALLHQACPHRRLGLDRNTAILFHSIMESQSVAAEYSCARGGFRPLYNLQGRNRRPGPSSWMGQPSPPDMYVPTIRNLRSFSPAQPEGPESFCVVDSRTEDLMPSKGTLGWPNSLTAGQFVFH